MAMCQQQERPIISMAMLTCHRASEERDDEVDGATAGEPGSPSSQVPSRTNDSSGDISGRNRRDACDSYMPMSDYTAVDWAVCTGACEAVYDLESLANYLSSKLPECHIIRVQVSVRTRLTTERCAADDCLLPSEQASRLIASSKQLRPCESGAMPQFEPG